MRGRFARFHGTIDTRENLADFESTVTIVATSIETGQPQRDDHLRSTDYLDTEHHPTWSFRSTGLRDDGENHVLDGELTIKGTARPVSLRLEINGFGPDGMGGYHAGFSASTIVDRHDYGVGVTMPLDGCGVVVGDRVQVAGCPDQNAFDVPLGQRHGRRRVGFPAPRSSAPADRAAVVVAGAVV